MEEKSGIYVTPEYVLDFNNRTATVRHSKEKTSVSFDVLDYLKKENWRWQKKEEKKDKNEISYFSPLKEFPEIGLFETIEDKNVETPDKRIKKLIQDEDISRLLSCLTEKQRQIITDSFLNENSSKNISRVLNITEAAVSRTKKNAVTKMKNLIENEDEFLPDLW